MLKRFLTFLLLMISAFGACADNAISMTYKQNRKSEKEDFSISIPLFSIDDAISAYSGDWNGTQSVFLLNGEKISNFKVYQTVLPITDKLYEMTVHFELPNGKNIFSKWIIENLGDSLKMSIVENSTKTTPKYLGKIQLTGIIWEPYYCVQAYDIMIDSLERHSDGKLYLKSTGFSTITNKDKSTFIKSESTLTKVQAP